MKQLLITLMFIALLPASLSATYIIEHRTNGSSGSSGNGTTIINNYNNSMNISGVTNQTQYFVVDTAPTSNFGNGFPQFFHNETTGVHTLGIGTLPFEGDPGLLTATKYNEFDSKVSSQWTSFGTTYPRGIYYDSGGISQVFMTDAFDVSNTTQTNNFFTALTGPVVINYYGDNKPHPNAGYLGFGYSLSIQKKAADAYLEIANYNGENQGVFFGNYEKNFELWDYAGGSIIFYTSVFPTDGYERVRITPNGSLVVGGIGTSGAYDTWNGWNLIGSNAFFTATLRALDGNFTRVVAPTINGTTQVCIAGDCRTSWPVSGGDNSTFNQTLTDSLYYPKTSNPLSYYNSSTLPSSSGEPVVNITELDTLWWFSLFPSTSATTATNMGANTGRGCKFSVPDNLWWNRTYVRTGATNTTIGISAGIYSCSSAMCETKTLVYNFTKQSLTNGNQVWVNTTSMWNLSAGTYWFVVALNTTGTTAQSVFSTGNNNINTGLNNNCGTFSTGGQASMPSSFTAVTGTTAYIVPLTLYTG